MKPTKPNTLFKTLAFSLVPVLCLLFVAEVSLRLRERKRPPYWRHLTRLTDPAYTSKPWFSKQFLTSSFTQPGSWFTPSDTTLILPKDYQDEFFTVVRAERQTTGFQWQLGDPPPIKLFLLGASNVYCSEVPDELTWASLLQSKLADLEATRSIRVFNYGTTSVKTSQMVERLKFEIKRGNVPDFCVIYTGANDVVQAVFNNKSDEAIFQTERNHRPPWYIGLAFKTAIGRQIMTSVREARQPAPMHLNDEQQIKHLATQAADDVAENLRQAKKTCDRYGVRLFVFLHPTLFAIERELNDHEAAALKRCRYKMKGCFDITYPMLQDRFARLRQEGIDAFDLTAIFDLNDQPIFLDAFHVESDGNAIVADAVYSRLQGSLLEDKRVARSP